MPVLCRDQASKSRKSEGKTLKSADQGAARAEADFRVLLSLFRGCCERARQSTGKKKHTPPKCKEMQTEAVMKARREGAVMQAQRF